MSSWQGDSGNVFIGWLFSSVYIKILKRGKMAEEDKNVNKLIRALAKDSGEHDEEKSSFPFGLKLPMI